MPDFWTHIIAGELILERVKNSDWQKTVMTHKKVFDFGCQGPDFFLYNDFLPLIRQKRGPVAGKLLHCKNTASLLSESIAYLKEKIDSDDFPLLLSYFLGFLVHYAIDKNTHPLINNRAKTGAAHKKLETDLDLYTVREYWNKDVHLLSRSEAIDIGKHVPDPIKEYYKHILSEVYHLTSVNYIDASYRDMIRVLNIFHCPGRAKKRSLHALNALLPYDISIYIYPSSKKELRVTRSEYMEIKKLFNEGVEEGVELVKLLLEELSKNMEKSRRDWSSFNINFEGKTAE